MTREQAKAILGEGATEEQITNLLNNYHNVEKENKNKIVDLENKLAKFNDYDDIKKQLDDINQSKMTEQEKIEQMRKEAEANLRSSRLINNTAKAKEILAGCNVSENLLNSLINEDEAKTIQNANELLNSFNSLKDEVAKATKESLVTKDVKPNLSNVKQNDLTMTIDKFTNLSVEEQNDFITNHPDEFKNLK